MEKMDVKEVNPTILYIHSGNIPTVCKGKPDTDRERCYGVLHGECSADGKEWGIILWEDEKEPNLYPVGKLLYQDTVWRELDTGEEESCRRPGMKTDDAA